MDHRKIRCCPFAGSKGSHGLVSPFSFSQGPQALPALRLRSGKNDDGVSSPPMHRSSSDCNPRLMPRERCGWVFPNDRHIPLNCPPGSQTMRRSRLGATRRSSLARHRWYPSLGKPGRMRGPGRCSRRSRSRRRSPHRPHCNLLDTLLASVAQAFRLELGSRSKWESE